MLTKKIKILEGITLNWTKLGRISLAIFAIAVIVITFLPKHPSLEQYCNNINPNDATKCDCVQTMKWHIRAYDEFNITDKSSWESLLNGSYQEMYDTTQVLEIYGNKTGFLYIKNVTDRHYDYYRWEEVNETCKVAKPTMTEKQQQKMEKCKNGCMEDASSCGRTNPTTTINNSCQVEFEKCTGKCER